VKGHGTNFEKHVGCAGEWQLENKPFSHRPCYKRANKNRKCGEFSNSYLYYLDSFQMWVISAELGNPPFIFAGKGNFYTPGEVLQWTTSMGVGGDGAVIFVKAALQARCCGTFCSSVSPTLSPTAAPSTFSQAFAIPSRAPTPIPLALRKNMFSGAVFPLYHDCR
jgi:hypothetical protein